MHVPCTNGMKRKRRTARCNGSRPMGRRLDVGLDGRVLRWLRLSQGCPRVRLVAHDGIHVERVLHARLDRSRQAAAPRRPCRKGSAHSRCAQGLAGALGGPGYSQALAVGTRRSKRVPCALNGSIWAAAAANRWCKQPGRRAGAGTVDGIARQRAGRGARA